MQYQEIICGNCGTPNPYGVQQCQRCGMLLNSPQQYQQTQYYYTAPNPTQIPVESGTNWAKVMTIVIAGLIVVVLCIGLTGITFYLYDPLGIFTANVPLTGYASQTSLPK